MKKYLIFSFLILPIISFLLLGCGKKVMDKNKKEVPSSLESNRNISAFKFTDVNFEDTALKNGVAVVDFWAEWCKPCRMVTPIINELAGKYEGKAVIGKLNVDHNQEITRKYGVRSIPTILVLKDGEIFYKHVGTITQRALAAKIDEALTN